MKAFMRSKVEVRNGLALALKEGLVWSYLLEVGAWCNLAFWANDNKLLP